MPLGGGAVKRATLIALVLSGALASPPAGQIGVPPIPRPGTRIGVRPAGVDASAPAGHRRAVLVGINDYSASKLVKHGTPSGGREWPDLNGATTDVNAMAEMLVLLYGFQRRDIITLTDQAATRAAILGALEGQLARSAAKGDVLLFYYAGHGSQVKNSLSEEPDRMDESLVPADSRAGARDIRDKELRAIFNRILDRGAALTVVLDNCHSGSGARAGFGVRGIQPDLRDVADATPGGPRPEDRGALVISATQDFDSAYEMRDAEGKIHGVFSWAWLRALRNAAAGEPARDTFLRAQAMLRAETPFQEPVLAGNALAQSRPFLGIRGDRRAKRTILAVRRVAPDGTVVLQGGWANGLAPGAELLTIDPSGTPVRLAVTAVRGLGVSEARVLPSSGRGASTTIRGGALVEVVGWAAPVRPLRVWMPPAMQLDLGASVQSVARASDADYVLTHRASEYAWVRSDAQIAAGRRTALPLRTDWVAAAKLPELALRLARIQSWQLLESPPEARSPYRLALRHGSALVKDTLVGDESYELLLRAAGPLPKQVAPRYIYIFVIDRFGRAVVLFPRNGSVENRFPLGDPAPAVIPLGETVQVGPPYGTDAYFLLTTDEPLPDPGVLSLEAVRTRAGSVVTPSTWSIEQVLFESVPPAKKSR